MDRVRSRRTSKTTTAADRIRFAIEAIEPRRMLAVDLQFDYTYDSAGFFNDPARRAMLEQAADAMTGAMTDFLDPIQPTGTDHWQMSFNNPGSGLTTTLTDPVIPADTIIVYAGAYNLPNPAVGLGGFAGYNNVTGSQDFLNTIKGRGNAGALRQSPTDFAPFAGSIAFDLGTDFYFGSSASVPNGETDFLSVAEHELGHLLGLFGARSFSRLITTLNPSPLMETTRFYTGEKTTQVYGDLVPMEPDDAHFLEGIDAGGLEPLMDPSIFIGSRKEVTALDLAALDDLGWDFDPQPLPTVNITTVDNKATEGGTDFATFRVGRTGRTLDPLDVDLSFGGTATRGSDYTLTVVGTDGKLDNDPLFNGNTLTIPSGASSVLLTVRPTNDVVIEPGELATLVAAADPSVYVIGTTGTVNIDDDDLLKLQQSRVAGSPVDVGTNGNPSNLGAEDLSFSADGRYATFVSRSTNLVSSPLTTFYQVYRRDLATKTTRLVSLSSSETAEANDDAVRAKINGDGNIVAFETTANDIVGGGIDRNGASDVYVKDMSSNRVQLVTKGVGGELLAISQDGEQILFQSSSDGAFFVRGLVDQNSGNDLFVWNRRTGKYSIVSANADNTRAGNRPTSGGSTTGEASFSGDGRFVVFPSRASDLVADQADGNTFQYDIFIRDIAAATTEYVSISSDAAVSANGPSGYGEATLDGRYIIFRSSGTDIVPGITDTNETQDIFVRDRLLGTTKLLSQKRTGGATGNGANGIPDITSDGRYAVFTSTSTNVVKADNNSISDAYLVDTRSGKVELITVNSDGDGGSGAPTIDAKITDDGSRVAFITYADNLPGDFDKKDSNFAALYTRDTILDLNNVVSFEESGTPAGSDASDVVLSADGTRIGFSSLSDSIQRPDQNNEVDIFVAPIYGHRGADLDLNGKLTIFGSPVSDSINIQRVNSRITVRRNEESFEFKAADVASIDVLTFDGNDSIVLGTNLMGTYASSGSGNDVIRGGGGNDRLQGGPGRDLIYGGAGDDRIDGGKNNDTIFGESGSDRLYGGDSNDLLDGGSGVDRFFGGIGTDTSVKHEDSDILDSIEELA